MAASIVLRLTGGSSNSNPSLSLGGAGSSIEVSTIVLNNLFDNVTPEVAESGIVQYRAIDLHNTGDDIAGSITMYLSETLSVGSSLSCGLDITTQSIINDNMPPSAVSFSFPTAGNPLTVPSIAVNGRQRVWICRTISPETTNYRNDTGTIGIVYA